MNKTKEVTFRACEKLFGLGCTLTPDGELGYGQSVQRWNTIQVTFKGC